MKLLTTLTIFYSALILSIQEDCSDEADACSADSAFITIACAKSTHTCTITTEGNEGSEDGEEISASQCKTKCEEQKAAAAGGIECIYYRWEETEKETSCNMMTECQILPCEGDYCSSGQIDCEQPGEVKTCPGPATYNSHNVHIECVNFQDGDLINIYVDDAIPAGTICKTTRKCDEWKDQTDEYAIYYRKLAAVCNGADGKWGPAVGTGDSAATTEMINQDGTLLVDQPCSSTCESLVLIKANLIKPGTDLFCEKELENDENNEKNTLVDGNSCILLCDNHLTMSISCQFNHGSEEDGTEEDGSKKWQDEERKEVTAELVTCWH